LTAKMSFRFRINSTYPALGHTNTARYNHLWLRNVAVQNIVRIFCISLKSLGNHIDQFYAENPKIPLGRRPDIIHVLGHYCLIRTTERDRLQHSISGESMPCRPGVLQRVDNHDVHGLTTVILAIQQYAYASIYIRFTYEDLFFREF
jgi:hypothetical protein